MKKRFKIIITGLVAIVLFSSFIEVRAQGQPANPQALSQTQKPPNGIIVALDPGHCSNDPYKENKVDENRLNLIQAKALGSLLQANGFDVRIYEKTPGGGCPSSGQPGYGYYKNLQDRVDFANQAGANAFISIHADYGEQTDSFNPIYSPQGPFPSESKSLADDIGAEIVKTLAAKNKTISTNTTSSLETGPNPGLDYYVLGRTGSGVSGAIKTEGDLESIQNQRNMAGVIVENYMKTKNDYSDIFPYVQPIALGYCNGIAKFFNQSACADIPGQSTGTPLSGTGASNMVCVKVGAPTTEKPAICSLPASSFTAIPGAGGFVHYCQNNNPAWPTGNGCTMAGSGCGPTSLAMVMSAFGAVCNGGTCDPAAVNSLMEGAKQRQPDCNSVVNGGAVESQWFKQAGMQTGPAVGGAGVNGFDFQAAKTAIDKGYLIIGSAENAPSCGGGNGCNHIFVIQDVDPANRAIHVRDPICSGNNQEFNYDDRYNNFIREGKLRWLYAIPVKGPSKPAPGSAQQGAE